MTDESGRKAFIFGATDLAVLLQSNLKSLGRNHVEAFVVDRRFRKESTLLGLPVIDTEDLTMRFDPAEYGCYVCVGYNGMNAHREKAHTMLRGMGYLPLNFFHPSAHVHCVSHGVGNLVFQNAIVDFFTEIGDGNIFYPNALVAHHNTIGSFNFFSVSCCVTGHVAIEDCCFIGANATVGNGISLGCRCLIGAGAYVSSPVKPYEVVVPQRSMVLEGKKSTDFL